MSEKRIVKVLPEAYNFVKVIVNYVQKCNKVFIKRFVHNSSVNWFTA